MTSTELKHQAQEQKWVAAIQDCRSSGLPVRQWCRQRGITPSTYYRWEREVLSIADAAPELGRTTLACLCTPGMQNTKRMNISGPVSLAKPEMLFYTPGDLTVTF